MEFEVETVEGDKTRFTPVKHASGIPWSSLQRSNDSFQHHVGSWSATPWIPFLSSRGDMEKDKLVICKMFEANRKTSQLAAVKHVDGDVWSMCKLDKNLKMKDIKQWSEQELNWTGLDDCAISPDWTQRSFAKLDLGPPDEPERNTTELLLSPSKKAAEDPSDKVLMLQHKYYDLLYVNQALPVAHFAKSTLARVRTEYKTEHASSKSKFKANMATCLNSVILKTSQFDTKYDTDAVLQFFKGKQGFPYVRSEVESKYLARWKCQVKDAKRALDQLKVRELQLQVVILLELLCLHNEQDTAPSKLAAHQQKISLVRRRKKKQDGGPVEEHTEQPQQDLQPDVLVDLAFDRLCIWQALNQSSSRKDKTQPVRDVPYELCREVLIPYYGNKLRDKTKLLAKKATGSGLKANSRNSADAASNSDHSKSLKQAVALHDGNDNDYHHHDQEDIENRNPVPVSTKASILKSQHEKRQVEMPAKIAKPKTQKQPTAEELAAAIKNASKPNRVSVSSELFDSNPSYKRKLFHTKSSTAAKESNSVVQVAAADNLMTPSMNRKRVQPTTIMTPVKRLKFGTTDDNNNDDDDIDENLDEITSTPMKGHPGNDTDED